MSHVVLLPGSLCDERLFTAQIDALGADHDVHVGDLTRSSSIEAMADDVLARAPDRFAVAGLSLGGIVATELASRAPERLTGVAVLDTNLAIPDGLQVERRTAWAQRARSGEFAQLIADEFVEPMTADAVAHGGLIFDMAFEAGVTTFLRQNEALLQRRDRRDDLASLSVPVLVAAGREDRMCPPHLHEDLAARTAHAELVLVDGAGHLSTIDQPAALNDALQSWLRRCHTITTTQRGRQP